LQLDTLVKLGSLAFSIAQDQKVREMVTMVHRGARRRGLIGPLPQSPDVAGGTKPQSASTAHTGAPAKPAPSAPAKTGPELPAWLQQLPASPTLPPALRRYVNRRTARQMARWTRRAAQMLIDPPRQP
jgi:hypothetical protein